MGDCRLNCVSGRDMTRAVRYYNGSGQRLATEAFVSGNYATKSYVDGQISSSGFFPDYNSVVTLQKDSGSAGSYTAPYNCWFIANIKQDVYDHHTRVVITIGDYVADIGANRDDSHGRWFGLPIQKGQTVSWSKSGKFDVYVLPMK